MNASELAHPLCDEEQFSAVLEAMVAATRPRLFAVVQEYGERVDARIAAWGMAFEDRAVAVSTRGGTWASLATPERVAGMYAWEDDIHTRLMWVGPPVDDEDDAPE